MGEEDSKMHESTTNDLTQIWGQVLDYEHGIIENLYKSMGDPCTFVEVGCGALGLLRGNGARLAGLYANSVGVDTDLESLSANKQVRNRVGGSCYSLPLKDNSADIVVCRWLFEHLENPEDAMREFARVLKKGGFLYIKTPNLLNYAMVISRLTPTAFHNLIRSAGGEHDNIPTFYRANTKRRLSRLAERHGFVVTRMECYPYSFMYYSFNRQLFRMMKGISQLVRKITNNVQLKLICVMQKA